MNYTFTSFICIKKNRKGKMKKKIIKTATFGVVATGIASALLPVSAEGVTPPSATTKATITVQNVDAADTNAEVKAYRIVKPEFNDHGLLGYKAVDGITIADLAKPTSEEVQAAVSYILAHQTEFEPVSLTRNGADFTAEAPAGEYVVLVSKSNTTVYNPAIVSVNIPNANVDAADGGTVNLNNAFANGKVAFLKRSTPTMEKNIIVDGQKKKGDLVSADGVGSTVADEITFQIDTQLPSYQVGENGTVYKNPRFEISDKLQDVFENISEIKIQNAAGADLVANTDYELVNGVGSKDFTVKFKSEYLMAHGNEAVKIVYKTKLTSTETNQNFADNKNVATLKYSNDPTNEQSVKIVKDKTYHYTFSIDGNIDGTWEESGSTIDGKQGKHQTHELNKVTERTESTTWEEKEDETHTFTKHSTKALAGAKFGLYSDEDAQTKVAETTSTDKGFMNFHGLDAGTYYLKEISAPAGYSLNDTVYKINIVANLDEEGVLTDYSISTETKVGAAWNKVGEMKYTNTKEVDNKALLDTGDENPDYGKVKNTIVTAIDNPTQIENTKLAALPSTGGVGTVMFTVAGIGLFCGFGYAFMQARKEKEELAK